MFELSDSEGKTLLQQGFEVIKGSNIVNINLKRNSNLSAGFYLLKAVGLEGNNVNRVMVK